MEYRIFYNNKVKVVMASIVTLSILFLALPCNCMALEDSRPTEKEHPCHYTSDSENNDSHNSNPHGHENCCCNSANFSFVSETGTISTKVKIVNFEKNTFYFPNRISSFVDQWVLLIDLIRGSPPNEDSFTSSIKTFLSLIQRWLI